MSHTIGTSTVGEGARSGGAASGANADRTTVLVVDDHPEVLTAIAEVIATDGALTVAGRASGVGEAIMMAHDLRPDVAVIDVNMRGGGGWALARRLRHSVFGIRLVAYSAWDAEPGARDRPVPGVEAYVIKGSDVQMLLDAIHGDTGTPPGEPSTPLLGRAAARHAGAPPRPAA